MAANAENIAVIGARQYFDFFVTQPNNYKTQFASIIPQFHYAYVCNR